jgi:hypothetical protein
MIAEHRGRLTLSDDTHGPAVGVSELWYLRDANIQNGGGRYVEAVHVEEHLPVGLFRASLKAGTLNSNKR